MEIYCIANHKNNKETAGAKAPDDVAAIAKKMGIKLIDFYSPHKFKSYYLTRFAAFFSGYNNWRRLQKEVKEHSYVILQHPNQGIRVSSVYIDKLKRNKDVHFIGLIHDLNSLRKICVFGKEQSVEHDTFADDGLLKKCDYVICHNTSMMNYMIDQGFDKKRLISLKIFDYLHDCELSEMHKKEKSVIVAGNLAKEKCEYLYKLMRMDEIGFQLHLFGPNLVFEDYNSYVKYHGSYLPEELPGKLQGAFGLVWDGSEIDKCAGNTGEYIRYNNPHKCSLFLASNIPVIIWKQAALAKFVEKNNVGITVNSLLEIADAIDRISEKEYEQMVRNAAAIGDKMRSGYYFQTALEKVRALI